MSAPSPSWYEVLGVAPDAPAERVRAAWRAAIADLDPADRRFELLNSAAEVLLNPDRRAAYDADLAPDPDPVPEPEPEPRREPEATMLPTRDRHLVPGRLLAGVAAVALIVGGAAVVVATVPSDRSVEEASGSARVAAERAIVPILSYDATHPDESRAEADGFLTGRYRTDYDRLVEDVISADAPSTDTVVDARLLGSGVARADEDRVEVFLLVDQSRTAGAGAYPVVSQGWVTVTMEQVDGAWLVSGLDI